MWDQEKVELAVLNLGLLDEARVDVRTLGWVLDELVALLCLALLEESLTDALVYDDQGDLRSFERGHREDYLLVFLSFCFVFCLLLLSCELGVFL